jgi:Protein of unknown function DUF262
MIEALANEVITVTALLTKSNLTIPAYQRPYKWTSKHVSQLFQDIDLHKNKKAYRLGTIVFHRDAKEQPDCLNIVDGQQRTLTLTLAVWALIETHLNAPAPHSPSLASRPDLQKALAAIKTNLTALISGFKFDNAITQRNLHQNYQEIKRLVSRPEFTLDHIDFLLNKCQVVTFTLTDVSEAFQFFDSQNARGRDLAPHDLLKAFHLREFSHAEADLKAKTVSHWEDLSTKALTNLFAEHLYRIRQWTRGKSARYFGKDDVSLFKGVNLDKPAHYPYVKSLRIAHHFVDDYNRQYERKIDDHSMPFPFHLDQMIINGRRFFEMIRHYHTQIEQVVAAGNSNPCTWGNEKLSKQAQAILKTLNEYDNKNRTGDRYVRSLFDCLLIYYVDKFGFADISRAIEKIFIWAYQVRIKQAAVHLASMDNHVLENNWFTKLKDAIQPSDFLNLPLTSISASISNPKTDGAKEDPLIELFKRMGYYHA